jgi:hypothetical protein
MSARIRSLENCPGDSKGSIRMTPTTFLRMISPWIPSEHSRLRITVPRAFFGSTAASEVRNLSDATPGCDLVYALFLHIDLRTLLVKVTPSELTDLESHSGLLQAGICLLEASTMGVRKVRPSRSISPVRRRLRLSARQLNYRQRSTSYLPPNRPNVPSLEQLPCPHNLALHFSVLAVNALLEEGTDEAER